MVAYLDSSVVLQHLLLGDICIKHAMECPRIVSSELLEIECLRVFNRCHMERELSDAALVEAQERFERLLEAIDILELSPEVKKRAGESFPICIKTLDALHLSSALILKEHELDSTVGIFSNDRTMNLCARALGFAAPFL